MEKQPEPIKDKKERKRGRKEEKKEGMEGRKEEIKKGRKTRKNRSCKEYHRLIDHN